MSSRPAVALVPEPTTSAFARFADRWVYVVMAGLFILTALIGFIPDSLEILAEIKTNERPPLSPVLHLHALCMGSWMLLLFAQALLIAVRRPSLHRRIGVVALGLVPLILVSMVLLVKITFQSLAPSSLMARTDPGDIEIARTVVSNLLPEQLRAGLLFGVFAAWGFWMRTRDSCAHRRLMMLATLMPLPAAIDRIDWLPSTLPASPDSTYLYMLLWFSPLLLYDLLRRGRLHWTYVAGMGLNLPFMITAHLGEFARVVGHRAALNGRQLVGGCLRRSDQRMLENYSHARPRIKMRDVSFAALGLDRSFHAG